MKKKFLSGIAALFIAIAVAFNVQMGMSEKNQLTDFGLANAKALADGESGGSGTSCFKSVTKAPNDDSLAVSVTDCKDCETYWVTSAGNKGTCTSN